MRGPPVLRVTGLGKVYPAGWGRPPTTALEPLDLEVAAGEIIGIVGESGSGKSTLARLLVGLERPTSGRLLLDGADITAANGAHRRAALQMVFQNPQSALNPRRTVAELLTQAMEPTAAPAARRRARAAELLAAVGLSAELAGRYPFQLSGGQRQRVNIGRALCVAPRILLADEIVSGLDVSVQAQLLNLLLQLRADTGLAIVLISHDLSVVRYLCDRVLVLHRGRLMETADAALPVRQPRLRLHPSPARRLPAGPAALKECPHDPRPPCRRPTARRGRFHRPAAPHRPRAGRRHPVHRVFRRRAGVGPEPADACGGPFPVQMRVRPAADLHARP